MNTLKDLYQTSSFPVSIGTGLSLETLFTPLTESVDPERVVENLPDLSVYTLYIFNVSTLVRNILSTFTFEQIANVPLDSVYEILNDEVEFLKGFFESNNVPIVFYVNSYSYFKKAYPDKLRKPTTDKQRRLDTILTYCLNKAGKELPVQKFDKDIHYGKEHRGLLFTHVPADLLSYGKFTTLDLLESHTGKIKSRKEWNTKYYPIPNKDMSFLPFMEYLLTTFGDKVMFSPDNLKKREEVYDSLKKKNVNPLTTEGALLFSLKGSN